MGSLNKNSGEALDLDDEFCIARLSEEMLQHHGARMAELQKRSFAVKLLMMLAHCCMWCLEKCVCFLTSHAYIMIAIEGKSFCISALHSLRLILSNSARMGITEALAAFLTRLFNIGITLVCTCCAGATLTNHSTFGTDGDNYGMSCSFCLHFSASYLF